VKLNLNHDESMTFSGYQNLDEIAEILNVEVAWLEEELSEQLADKQFTLLGEVNYLSTDLHKWLINRRPAITEAQKRCRALKSEITPRARIGLLGDLEQNK
jgi:hypothetical protein